MDTKKSNILLVDDRRDNLLTLEAVLDCPDYNLISINSGEEALRYILNENVEQLAVILLDVQMPGLDGFETAKLIKSREYTQDIPIIFITAISKSIDHVLKGYVVGSVDYIFKPFQPEVLRKKVAAFVKMHQIHQQVKQQGKLLEKRAIELEVMNKKLAKTEMLARIVGETSKDSIITCNERGYILSINPAVKGMFLYREEELLGRPIKMILPNLQSAAPLNIIFELIAYRKDRSNIAVEVQKGKAIAEGQIFYVYSIRDITEKKLIEEMRMQRFELLEQKVIERTKELLNVNKELRRSQQLFQTLFVSSPGLMSITRLSDGRVLEVNESWCFFTGYTLEEANEHQGDLLCMAVNYPDEVLSRGKSCRNVQIKYNNKKGETRDGLLSVEVIEIDFEPCELAVIIDITEKVKWETELARLDQLNLIGEMAAGIAHEIRNPMTTISGFLQYSKKAQTVSNEHIDIMLEELNRAYNIITEFLSLATNKTSHFVPCQLNDIIASLMPLLQADAMLTGKSIEPDYGLLPILQLDEKEIRQLILNLSINGLEAMSAGGVLRISTYLDLDEAVLQIEDQGIGMKPEVLEKLGTPFFTTKDGGTGLGLAVCYSIATRHHAKISVTSSKQGTTFQIRFPYVDM